MAVGKRWQFETYSYAEQLTWKLLDLCPHALRNLVFRMAFKRFGHGCLIDYDVYVRYPFKVSIGDCTAINRGCRLYPSFLVKGAEIVIGSDVALGPHVTLFSAGHDHQTIDLKDTAATISIGDRAWIGGGSIILQGVTIGEGAVVGAGSVVTRDVPPWSIAVGNPAKVVGAREISAARAS